MRRLFIVGAVVGLALAARCYLRGQHKPRRVFLGLRCADCGAAGADYDEMLGVGAGWVSPTRKVFDRTTGTVTRTSHFDPSMRGPH